MGQRPQISIVTPSRGDMLKLSTLKKSLQSQNLYRWEWLIVLTDDQREPYRSRNWNPDARIKRISAPGSSVNRARNKGAREAQSNLLLFLDDDTLLPGPSSLIQRILLHTQVDKIVWAGGYESPLGANLWDRSYNRMCNLWLDRWESTDLGVLPLGGNFSCDRSLFLENTLDESHCFGGEETSSFLRWKKQNVPFRRDKDSWVFHSPEKDLSSFFKTAWIQGRSKRLQSQLGASHTPFSWSLVSRMGLYAPLIGIYWLTGEAAKAFSPKKSPSRATGVPSFEIRGEIYKGKST